MKFFHQQRLSAYGNRSRHFNGYASDSIIHGARLMTHGAEGKRETPPRQIKTAMVKLTVPSAR